MAENSSHLDQLKEIRQIMEKSTRFISLSGVAGIWVGSVALAGIAILIFRFSNHFVTRYASGGVFNYDDLLINQELSNFLWFSFFDAIAILALSLVGAVALTVRKARKKGQSIWDSTAKRFLVSMMVPLTTGGILTLILAAKGYFELAGPITLIFYGLALFNGGRYSLNDIRYLGLLEILLGLLSALFTGYSAIFWAIGFGVLHIIYGAAMYFKYERE